MQTRLGWLTGIVAIALAQATAQAQAPRVFDADVILALRSVGDPQLSPDGRMLAYPLSWLDRGGTGVEQTVLVVRDLESGAETRLDGIGAIRWAPDSRRFAYFGADAQGHTQLFVRTLDEGSAVQVTRGEGVPKAVVWSPDGRWIAFGRRAGGEPAPTYIWPEGVAPGPTERIVDRLHYKFDGSGILPQGFTQVFAARSDGSEVRQLTHGPGEALEDFSDTYSQMDWTPDSRALIVPGNFVADSELRYRESYLHRVPLDGSGPVRLFDLPGVTDNWNDPRVSPDGRHIAYAGYSWTEHHTARIYDLWVADADGGNLRRLTQGLGTAAWNLRWTPDGQAILFTDQRDGHDNLYRAGLDGTVTSVTSGLQFLAPGSAAADGTIAASLSRPTHPAEIVLVDPVDGSIEPVTQVNAAVLRDVDLGQVEPIAYASADGMQVHAWLYLPPGFDPGRRYPLIVTGHGGPQMMGSAAEFSNENYHYAALGYVVLYPNYRGSTGYGEDFLNTPDPWFPNPLVTADVLAGVDAVIARGFVDPDRLFITGYSAGGVLTAWMVGQTDRFRAAAAQASETNRISDAMTSDTVQWFASKYPVPFWEDASSWIASSPVHHAGKVTTPTLFIVGELDRRTPPTQSNEMYSALRLANRAPTRLIYVPEADHGTEWPGTYAHLRWRHHIIDWFRRFDPALAGADAATASPPAPPAPPAPAR